MLTEQLNMNSLSRLREVVNIGRFIQTLANELIMSFIFALLTCPSLHISVFSIDWRFLDAERLNRQQNILVNLLEQRSKIINMSNSYVAFNWCLGALRVQYQYIGQDIFRERFQYGLGFFLFVASYLASIIACCYTIINYDQFTAFVASNTMLGVIQVIEMSYKRHRHTHTYTNW